MKKQRDSFIFYRSFYEAINDLPKDNQLEVYKAICELSLNFKDVKLDGLSKTIFKLIKPQIDANNKRYINGSKGGEYGYLGGRPKKPQLNPTKTPNINLNVNVNENENENDNNINIAKYCEYNWQRTLTPTEITKLQEFEDVYGFDEVKKAIDISCEQHALKIAYIRGILLKKDNKPKWIDKDIKKQELTNEEKEEMERMLKDFK